jgi:hypothetical protein
VKTRAQQEAREGGAQEEKEVEAGVPVWVAQAQARDMRAQLRGIKFTCFTSTKSTNTGTLQASQSCGCTPVLGLLALLVQKKKRTNTDTPEPPLAELRMRIHKR